MTFAQNVKRFRLEKGMTQGELAGALGISAQAVSKWETTETYPDCSLLCELSGVLGVSLDMLFDNHVCSMREISNDVHDLIADTPVEERIQAAYDICWQIQKALVMCAEEKQQYSEYPQPKRTYHSYILCEDGFTHVSGASSPFFAIFPQCGDSWAEIIGDGERMRQIFERLSSPETMKGALFLLGKKKGLLFEAEVFARACDIPEDYLDAVMDNLHALGIIAKNEIEIDGEKRTLYISIPDHRLLALFLLAGSLHYNGPFTMRTSTRNRPLL